MKNLLRLSALLAFFCLVNTVGATAIDSYESTITSHDATAKRNLNITSFSWTVEYEENGTQWDYFDSSGNKTSIRDASTSYFAYGSDAVFRFDQNFQKFLDTLFTVDNADEYEYYREQADEVLEGTHHINRKQVTSSYYFSNTEIAGGTNSGFLSFFSILDFNQIAIPRNIEFTTSKVGTQPISPVPEPATLILFGTGLSALACSKRRRKKR